MILVIISYFSLRTVRKPRNKLFITAKCQAVKRKKQLRAEGAELCLNRGGYFLSPNRRSRARNMLMKSRYNSKAPMSAVLFMVSVSPLLKYIWRSFCVS